MKLSKGTVIVANEDCYDMSKKYIPAGTSLEIIDTAIMDHVDFVWFIARSDNETFSIPCSYSIFFSPVNDKAYSKKQYNHSRLIVLYYKLFINIYFISFCLFLILSFIS